MLAREQCAHEMEGESIALERDGTKDVPGSGTETVDSGSAMIVGTGALLTPDMTGPT